MDSEGRARVSPLQPRGKQSVGKMLDATGELIDEVGYEHLTTQQVARRSGVSIGLVYHYFPDRLALVEALIARNSERFMAAVTDRLENPQITTWREALNAVLDVLIEMYRSEPGFCKIGLNDRFLTAQSAPVIADQDHLAAAFLNLFRERYAPETAEPPDLLLHFEIAVQLGDALMGRAFHTDRNGEERVLAEARRVLEGYLAPFLEGPDVAAAIPDSEALDTQRGIVATKNTESGDLQTRSRSHAGATASNSAVGGGTEVGGTVSGQPLGGSTVVSQPLVGETMLAENGAGETVGGGAVDGTAAGGTFGGTAAGGTTAGGTVAGQANLGSPGETPAG
jgi:AcrR family transcriptional regulator